VPYVPYHVNSIIYATCLEFLDALFGMNMKRFFAACSVHLPVFAGHKLLNFVKKSVKLNQSNSGTVELILMHSAHVSQLVCCQK